MFMKMFAIKKKNNKDKNLTQPTLTDFPTGETAWRAGQKQMASLPPRGCCVESEALTKPVNLQILWRRGGE